MNRLFFILMLSGCTEICKTVSIVEVGGCDRYGTCSFLTKDGETYTGDMPVKGGTKEVCKFK